MDFQTRFYAVHQTKSSWNALVLQDLAATKSTAVPAGSKQGTQAAEEEQ